MIIKEELLNKGAILFRLYDTDNPEECINPAPFISSCTVTYPDENGICEIKGALGIKSSVLISLTALPLIHDKLRLLFPDRFIAICWEHKKRYHFYPPIKDNETVRKQIKKDIL